MCTVSLSITNYKNGNYQSDITNVQNGVRYQLFICVRYYFFLQSDVTVIYFMKMYYKRFAEKLSLINDILEIVTVDEPISISPK
jgi:hypothetical protein